MVRKNFNLHARCVSGNKQVKGVRKLTLKWTAWVTFDLECKPADIKKKHSVILELNISKEISKETTQQHWLCGSIHLDTPIYRLGKPKLNAGFSWNCLMQQNVCHNYPHDLDNVAPSIGLHFHLGNCSISPDIHDQKVGNIKMHLWAFALLCREIYVATMIAIGHTL